MPRSRVPAGAVRCEGCRFWGGEDTDATDDPSGTCRRHAPVPVADSWVPFGTSRPLPDLQARWRWTRAEDWCGEGVPLPAAAADAADPMLPS